MKGCKGIRQMFILKKCKEMLCLCNNINEPLLSAFSGKMVIEAELVFWGLLN